MLADPELANPPPSKPEAMQSGWVPNPERDGFKLGASPQVDCCLRRQLNRNESVINLLCGHLTHEGCVTDLFQAYSLEGCRVCCDRSTNQQRNGELVNSFGQSVNSSSYGYRDGVGDEAQFNFITGFTQVNFGTVVVVDS